MSEETLYLAAKREHYGIAHHFITARSGLSCGDALPDGRTVVHAVVDEESGHLFYRRYCDALGALGSDPYPWERGTEAPKVLDNMLMQSEHFADWMGVSQ